MIATLMTRIRQRLERDLADLSQAHQGKKPKGDFPGPPRVWIGDQPPKNMPDSTIPCVVIVPVGGFQAEAEAYSVAIDLELSVYNPEGDAEKKDTVGAEYDMANLVGWITQSLYPLLFTKDERLDDRYWIVPDGSGRLFYWQKYEGQQRPFLEAVMHTVWQFAYME